MTASRPTLLIFAVLFAALLSAQEPAALGKQDIAVLYAGEPGNAREKAFTELLSKWFRNVGTIDLRKLSAETAKRYDVIVADWRRYYGTDGEASGQHRSEFTLPTTWSRPTIMIGAVAGEIAGPLHTKINWL